MADLQMYRDLYKLDGKVALVAGGAGGIGSAICQGLAGFGAKIVIADIAPKKEEAEAQIKDLQAAGAEGWFFGMDVRDVPSLDALVADITKQVGTPDILINCVGTHTEAPAIEYSEKDWDRIFTINLKGAFFLSQAVAKAQMARGGVGKHVHITSVRSHLALAHRGYVSYVASKGGLGLMIKQLAVEWAEKGITVNGIAPTFTRTDLVKKYLEDPSFYNPLVARIPLGRVCEPMDIAGLAIFLSSPASDFINGQNIFIDGGLTACQ